MAATERDESALQKSVDFNLIANTANRGTSMASRQLLSKSSTADVTAAEYTRFVR
jgi:hypothetical protein